MTTPFSPPPTTRFVAVRDQVSADLGGEAAVLKVTTGVYYGLNEVGARIWSLLAKPVTAQEITDALVAEYEVEAERCAADVLGLLQQLLSEGLVELREGPAR